MFYIGCKFWLFLLCTMTKASEYSQLIPDNASRFKLSSRPEFIVNGHQTVGKDKTISISSVSSEMTSSPEDSAIQHDIVVNYPSSKSTQVSSYRIPREQMPASNSFSYNKKKGRKVRPGQYASKAYSSKNKNHKSWTDYLKSAIDSSDSNIAWSYWETEEEEPDDADDSKMTTTTSTTTPSTTTTTTTTTAAPKTTMKDKTGSVTIHKHFHYFKKAAPWAAEPWKGDKAMPTSAPAPSPMTMEEMMKMPDDMMEEMMMKGMMMMHPHTDSDMKKGGLSQIFEKLSKVEPITILVAGIIPASLILAAALPSVMSKMMAMKGDANMMATMPTVTTTAVGGNGDMDMMGSRSHFKEESLISVLEAVGDFGMKALEKPECARMMFCKLASEKLVADSPIIQRAVQMATVAMEETWLQYVGVQSLLKSLHDGTCNKVDCDDEFVFDNLILT